MNLSITYMAQTQEVKKYNMAKKKDMVISLKDIHKIYTSGGGVKTVALDGVNLEIERGEFLAIMGPSGSGKSSLMNIVGLLDRKYEGIYKLNGKNVSKLSDDAASEIRNQEIGFVFQQFNLLKRTSVLDNVLLPTTYKSTSKDELRAIEVIKRVGLGDRIHNKSNQLSGGQIQRVAIARALMMEPSILLTDEPTGNLDSKTAEEIMILFDEINASGTTIILITHEDPIAEHADRRIKLFDGLITEDKR